MCHSPPPFSMFAGRKVLADTYAALGLYILRIYLTGDRKERQCGASHGRTEAVVDVQSYTTSLMHEPSNAVSSPSQKSDRGSPVQRLVTVLALGQRHGPIVDVEIWPLCGRRKRLPRVDQSSSRHSQAFRPRPSQPHLQGLVSETGGWRPAWRT